MANENMIQTHVDNFLAKIAGEVPADENVRTSQEFWLNEIAKWTAGQSTDDASTKKIYYHPITAYTSDTSVNYQFVFSFIIVDNSPTAYTRDAFISKIADFTRVSPVCGCILITATNKKVIPGYAYLSGTSHRVFGININDNIIFDDASVTLEGLLMQTGVHVADGVNAIN